MVGEDDEDWGGPAVLSTSPVLAAAEASARFRPTDDDPTS